LRGFGVGDFAGIVGVSAAVDADATHLATLAVFADCFAVIIAVQGDEVCVGVKFATLVGLARGLKDVWVLAPFASKGRDTRILCIRHAALEEGGVAGDKNPGGRGILSRAYRVLMIRQIMVRCRVRYAVVKCVCEVD
jgi:hypothetical protein